MAEAFLDRLTGGKVLVKSAGLEPGNLNPLAVKVMAEVGIDIAKNQTKSVEQIITNGNQYDYVITVCDETSAKRCPAVPGQAQRIHWNFPDPSRVTGPLYEQMAAIRQIRDAIQKKVEEWYGNIRANWRW